MERIPHRELRNNSSAILRRVAEGESFEITNHGEVVAVLSPPIDDHDLFDVVQPASRHGGWGDLDPARGLRPMQEVLDELREERL